MFIFKKAETPINFSSNFFLFSLFVVLLNLPGYKWQSNMFEKLENIFLPLRWLVLHPSNGGLQ